MQIKKLHKTIQARLWDYGGEAGAMADGRCLWKPCSTCGVVPGWQADGFLEEAELGVVEPERLVDHVRRRLHVHLADGHRLAVFCRERDLWREGQRSAGSAACRRLHATKTAFTSSRVLRESQLFITLQFCHFSLLCQCCGHKVNKY